MQRARHRRPNSTTCTSDSSLGVRPAGRRRDYWLHHQPRLLRHTAGRRLPAGSGGRVYRHIPAGFGFRRAPQSQDLRHHAQRLWHPDRRSHGFFVRDKSKGLASVLFTTPAVKMPSLPRTSWPTCAEPSWMRLPLRTLRQIPRTTGSTSPIATLTGYYFWQTKRPRLLRLLGKEQAVFGLHLLGVLYQSGRLGLRL